MEKMLTQEKKIEKIIEAGKGIIRGSSKMNRHLADCSMYRSAAARISKLWIPFIENQRVGLVRLSVMLSGDSFYIYLITRKEFLRACKESGMKPLYETKDIPDVFVITTSKCLIPSFCIREKDYYIHGHWGFLVPFTLSEFILEYFSFSNNLIDVLSKIRDAEQKK